MSNHVPVPDSPDGDGSLRILVPLDGSELAAQALPIAERICRQLSAQLDLVSIVQPALVPYVGGEPYVPGEAYARVNAARTRDAEAYLAATAASLREHGVPTQMYVEWGDPASRILDKAKHLKATLIVMTTHGRTGLARFSLGSVADRVVRGGAAPVLLIRSYPAPAHGQDLSRALIPLDGSIAASASVFSLVPMLAGSVLRAITLMRVADPRDGDAGREACASYLNAVYQRLLDRLAGRDCVMSMLVRSHESPAESILEISENGVYDLVLMPTHGETSITRWAFGGATDHVLRGGKTPLLLVHSMRQ